MRVAWPLVASLVTLAGCSGERPQSVIAPVQATAGGPSPPSSSGAEPPEASLAPPTAVRPGASAQGNACLMLYECGCNAGCTPIDRPYDALQVGMRVGVLSGPLKGTTVFVARNTTAEGESVLTVQRRDPSSPIEVCRRVEPTLGYLCSTASSGAARTCRSCAADDG